ncbi:hypothetical protein C8R45DRAFT_1107654 [Mycena sanguinolenta]|nr:hypothetical protein C8R45DRAFT_1107654 [Mycena sanguinolenta]
MSHPDDAEDMVISPTSPLPTQASSLEHEIFDSVSDEASPAPANAGPLVAGPLTNVVTSIAPSDSGSPFYLPPVVTPQTPYTIPEVLRVVQRMTCDSLFMCLLWGMLSGPEFRGSFGSESNMWKKTSGGKFKVRSFYRALFTDRLVTCAGLIATTLNNQVVKTCRFSAETVRIDVPTAAFRESGLGFPVILMFLFHWRLDDILYDTQAQVEEIIQDFFTAFQFGIAQLALLVGTTKRLGNASLCNPGAGMEMEQAEFLKRAGQPDRLFDELEAWVQSVVRCSEICQGADIAYSRLYADQGVSTFYILEADGRSSLVPISKPGRAITEVTPPRITVRTSDFGRVLAERGGY